MGSEQQQPEPPAAGRRPRRRTRVRRTGALALLLVLAAGTVLYVKFTRPARLRALLIGAILDVLPGAQVEVGQVSFTPWGGLQARELHVVLARTGPGAAPPTTLRASRTDVGLDLTDLLAGRTRVTNLRLADVTLDIVQAPPAERAPPTAVTHRRRVLAADLPPLRVERATLRWGTYDGAQVQATAEWHVGISGGLESAPAPGAGAAPTYLLRLNSSGGPREALASVRLDADGGGGQLALQWLPLKLVVAAAQSDPEFGPALAGVVSDLGGAGEFRLAEYAWRDDAPARARLELRDLSAAVPVEVERETPAGPERSAPRARRYLQVAAGQGLVALDGATLNGTLTGTVTGAPARVVVHAAAPAGSAEPNAAAAPAADWSVEIVGEVNGLQFPEAPAASAFISSPRLPSALRAFFHDYQPRGRLRLSMRAAKPPAPAERRAPRAARPWAVDGSVEALDAQCRYFRFPYVLEQVRGAVRYEHGRVELAGLSGRHGGGWVYCDGMLDSPASHTGFALRLRGASIPLDGDLYAALPATYRRLWDDARLLGLADVEVLIARPNGTPETGARDAEVTVDVDGRLTAVNLQLAVTPVQYADGAVRIREGVVTLRDLRGAYGDATVRVSGQAATVGSEGAAERWQFDAGGVRVSPTSVTSPSAGSTTAAALDWRYAGTVDLWGQSTRDGPGAAQTHLVARLLDGTLRAYDPKASWTDVQGWVTLDNGGETIRSLTARGPTGSLSISGPVPGTSGAGGLTPLVITADTPALDQLLRQVVPPAWAAQVARLGLSGAGRLELRICPQNAEPHAPLAADVKLTAAQMRLSVLPLPMHDVAATFKLTAAGFTDLEAQAHYGEHCGVRVAGWGDWERDPPQSTLSVQALNLPLSTEVLAALPARLRTFMQRLGPAGQADVTMDELWIAWSPEPQCTLRGEVTFKGATLELGLPLKNFGGRLVGAFQMDAAGAVTVDTKFQIDTGTLGDRPLGACEGRLRTQPGRNAVLLEEVTGALCGGELRGFGELDPNTSQYRLSFSLHDVELDGFMRPGNAASATAPTGATPPTTTAPVSARLDGQFSLEGKQGQPGMRRGHGALLIRGASIVRTPVLSTVAQSRPEARQRLANNAELIDIDFDVQGSVFDLNRVNISSGSARLVGKGTWQPSTDQLELSLLLAPLKLPTAPPFNLVDIAREELAQYHVTGTAAKPQVSLEPLHNVNEMLREIFEDAAAPH